MKSTFLFSVFVFILISFPDPVNCQEAGYHYEIIEIQTALNSGEAEKSYELASNLVSSYPDSSQAWYLKSQVEKQLFQYKKALSSALNALNINPGTTSYYYLAAGIYSDLQDYTKSISYCDSILLKDSGNFFASIGKAQALVKEGMFYEAIIQYTGLHRKDSTNGPFIRQIGSLYSKVDSLDKAISWYTKAVELDSTDIQSYTHLGNLYVKSEKYETGLPVMNYAISLDSSNSWLFRFRGSLNIMGGNIKEGESDFRRTIELGDSSAFSYRHLGLCLYKQAKYEEAFPVYLKTTELDPEDPKAWYYLAFCYTWREDIENALICMDKALSYSATPGISSVYTGLAQFHAIRREYYDAMHFYERAYEWNEDDPVPLAQLGMLIEQTGGDKEEAKDYYELYINKSEKLLDPDEDLDNYIRNRIQAINEKLFFEGKLQKN